MSIPLDIRVTYEKFTNNTWSLEIQFANDELFYGASPTKSYTITQGLLDPSTDTYPTIEDAITDKYAADAAFIVAGTNTAYGTTDYVIGQRVDFLQSSTRQVADDRSALAIEALNLGDIITHDAAEFATPSSVDDAITSAISALENGAGAAMDTLGEIATQIAADETGVAAMLVTIGNKTDKSITVNGKALSGNVTLNSDDISEGSTNKWFTAARAIGTALTGFVTTTSSAVLATDSVLVAIGKLQAQINDLQTFKAGIKVSKIEAFSATSDASGLFSFTTSTSFTSPKIILTPQAGSSTEGYEANVISVSGTTVNGIVFHNKQQSVLVGGTIDPDAPSVSTTVHGLVVQV